MSGDLYLLDQGNTMALVTSQELATYIKTLTGGNK